jgi:hypothetical protein
VVQQLAAALSIIEYQNVCEILRHRIALPDKAAASCGTPKSYCAFAVCLAAGFFFKRMLS